jgi:Cu(I)/Ag(I) efflux system membrane fusion protein
LWDLSADQIAALAERGQPDTHLVFRSPASGYVVEKSVVQGQRVMAGQSLYRLADLSVVWVEADLYEQDVPFVRVGDRATVTLDAYPGEPISARVIHLYPYADAAARTVRARLAIGNPNQRFRPGLYAGVELKSSLGEGVTVPSDAVLDSGAEQVVFVAEGDGYFVPRRVTAGRRFEGHIEIREGLAAGEVVAAGAAFFLDSESQLRAAIPGSDAAPTPAAAGGGDPPRDLLQIAVATRPDPPRAGDNTFEVTVRDASGSPVTGATVTVSLFMPAMPSMNMPVMRAEVALIDAGDGRYRGQGEIGMAGRWDVTVTVRRDGRTLGRVQRALVAR